MSNLNDLPQPGPGCVPAGITDNQGIAAFTLRFGTATNEAVKTGSVTHPVSTDLTNFTDGLGTYTKALKQTSPAIVDPATYEVFLQACGLAAGGTIIHELGGARMGADPSTSVVNANCQAHDVKNLFVMDGASFVSSACQNPTLSMMAIAVRACDHLVDRFKHNDV